MSKGNLETLTIRNKNYRKVLHTTNNMQLVLMSLLPDEEIGAETHEKTTQFIRVESGKARAIVKNKVFYLKAGDFITIPPKNKHNIINNGDEPLKLYTIYTPPQHPRDLVQKYKLS